MSDRGPALPLRSKMNAAMKATQLGLASQQPWRSGSIRERVVQQSIVRHVLLPYLIGDRSAP